jgi:hypothetical protein
MKEVEVLHGLINESLRAELSSVSGIIMSVPGVITKFNVKHLMVNEIGLGRFVLSSTKRLEPSHDDYQELSGLTKCGQ